MTYDFCMSASSTSSSAAGVVSFEDARHTVEQHAAGLCVGQARAGDGTGAGWQKEVETVDLLAGVGRVLAEEIVADRDFPPFARATREGYAVRAADVERIPARLEVVGEVKAGGGDETSLGGIRLERGQAVGIMTGAPVPEGADAVVMVEYTEVSENWVEIRRGVKPGENFVLRGAEARAGQSLVERGRRLDHAGVAIAASVGKSRVKVFRKPRVAVIATGDEVVEIEATPGPAEIRNSNSYSLAAQILNAGGEAVRLGIARDERERLQALIEEGLKCDLLLLAGGVSMGKYDLVEQVLGELGAEFYFTGAAIQPGRPVVFGACGDREKKYFFGLPGNPVSTIVTFELFVRPMIEALAGMAPRKLAFVRARLKSEIRTKTGLKRFLPALLGGEFENAEVELVKWQGSGDVAALGRANCYVVIAAEQERVEAGEWVPVMMR
jgi:molybdopterin molybdotransferase